MDEPRHLSVKVRKMRFGDIKPYKRNPRLNNQAVEAVQRSIENFTYLVPMVIDSKGEIAAGHTRYMALKQQGVGKDDMIDVVDASALSPAQVKAFRIADNKSHEFSEWDYAKLLEEVEALRSLDDVELSSTLFSDEELESLRTFGEDYKRGGEGEGWNELIDSFDEPTGGSAKDEKWFYFDYYGDKERYDAMLEALQGRDACPGRASTKSTATGCTIR